MAKAHYFLGPQFSHLHKGNNITGMITPISQSGCKESFTYKESSGSLQHLGCTPFAKPIRIVWDGWEVTAPEGSRASPCHPPPPPHQDSRQLVLPALPECIHSHQKSQVQHVSRSVRLVFLSRPFLPSNLKRNLLAFLTFSCCLSHILGLLLEATLPSH